MISCQKQQLMYAKHSRASLMNLLCGRHFHVYVLVHHSRDFFLLCISRQNAHHASRDCRRVTLAQWVIRWQRLMHPCRPCFTRRSGLLPLPAPPLAAYCRHRSRLLPPPVPCLAASEAATPAHPRLERKNHDFPHRGLNSIFLFFYFSFFFHVSLAVIASPRYCIVDMYAEMHCAVKTQAKVFF